MVLHCCISVRHMFCTYHLPMTYVLLRLLFHPSFITEIVNHPNATSTVVYTTWCLYMSYTHMCDVYIIHMQYCMEHGQVWVNISYKGPDNNGLGIACRMVSLASTQLCYCRENSHRQYLRARLPFEKSFTETSSRLAWPIGHSFLTSGTYHIMRVR